MESKSLRGSRVQSLRKQRNKRPRRPRPSALVPQAIARRSSTMHAKGTFEVKFDGEETLVKAAAIARMSLVKRFHGDLEADSRGEMLATMEPNRSGAYAALERVTGTLNGRD